MNKSTEKKLLNTLLGVLMVSGIAAESRADCLINEQGYANVSGEYFAMTSSGTVTAPDVYIKQKGNTLVINSGPGGTVWSGSVSGMTVNIPSAGLIATFANNCNELVWNDGNASSWVRK